MNNALKFATPARCACRPGCTTAGSKWRCTTRASASPRRTWTRCSSPSASSTARCAHHEGAGLGLYLSRRLLDLMGGRRGPESPRRRQLLPLRAAGVHPRRQQAPEPRRRARRISSAIGMAVPQVDLVGRLAGALPGRDRPAQRPLRGAAAAPLRRTATACAAPAARRSRPRRVRTARCRTPAAPGTGSTSGGFLPAVGVLDRALGVEVPARRRDPRLVNLGVRRILLPSAMRTKSVYWHRDRSRCHRRRAACPDPARCARGDRRPPTTTTAGPSARRSSFGAPFWTMDLRILNAASAAFCCAT